MNPEPSATPDTPSSPPEAALIRLAADGDDAAFAELVDRYFGLAYAVALARLRDPDRAEELAQEVFLRVYLRLSTLRDPRLFPAWIIRITRNLAADWIKADRRSSALLALVPLDSSATILPDMRPLSPRDFLVREEERRSVQAALDTLPVFLRELILLHYGEELSKSDIARRMGLHPSNVARQLERALTKLRKNLVPRPAALNSPAGADVIAGGLSSSERNKRGRVRAALWIPAVAQIPPLARAELLDRVKKTPAPPGRIAVARARTAPMAKPSKLLLLLAPLLLSALLLFMARSPFPGSTDAARQARLRTLPDGQRVELLTVERFDPTLEPGYHTWRRQYPGYEPVRVVLRTHGFSTVLPQVEFPRYPELKERDPHVARQVSSVGDGESALRTHIGIVPAQVESTTITIRMIPVHGSPFDGIASYTVPEGEPREVEVNGIRFVPNIRFDGRWTLQVEVTDNRYDGHELRAVLIGNTGGRAIATFELGIVRAGQIARAELEPHLASRVSIEAHPPVPEDQGRVVYSSVPIVGPTREQFNGYGTLVAPLKGGGRLELIALRDPADPDNRWWKPDGTLTDWHFAYHDWYTGWRNLRAEQAVEVVMCYRGPAGVDLETTTSFPYSGRGGWSPVTGEKGTTEEPALILSRQVYFLPAAVGKADFQVRATRPTFRTVATFRVNEANNHPVIENGIIIEPPLLEESDDASTLTIRARYDQRYDSNQVRAVVYFKDPGREPVETDPRPGFFNSRRIDYFMGLGGAHRDNRIDRCEFQVRSFETVTFHDVALQSEQPTQPYVWFKPSGTQAGTR